MQYFDCAGSLAIHQHIGSSTDHPLSRPIHQSWASDLRILTQLTRRVDDALREDSRSAMVQVVIVGLRCLELISSR